ncbi:MAG: hypothetical protein HWE22_13960 [Flavobacteriales bacterium]|nr:hypothetical protein [Flavobacteriales bacterium]
MGDLEKNGNAESIVVHTAEEFQKLALSFIPGGAVLDSVLNYRANLKQKRVIAFSESLRNVLEQNAGRELQAEDFTNEDFIDVMELVMSKVHSTKSNYKLERFRNILLKQIVAPIEFHETINYVRILDDLQEIDLYILSEMRNSESMKSHMGIYKMFSGENELVEKEKFIQLNIGGNEIELTYGDIEFYINRLTSQGLFKLLTRHMSGRGKSVRSREMVVVSSMGNRFLDFVEFSNS